MCVCVWSLVYVVAAGCCCFFTVFLPPFLPLSQYLFLLSFPPSLLFPSHRQDKTREAHTHTHTPSLSHTHTHIKHRLLNHQQQLLLLLPLLLLLLLPLLLLLLLPLLLLLLLLLLHSGCALSLLLFLSSFAIFFLSIQVFVFT